MVAIFRAIQECETGGLRDDEGSYQTTVLRVKHRSSKNHWDTLGQKRSLVRFCRDGALLTGLK